MAHYNTYHPNLKLLAINNLLPTYYLSFILASTLSTWKGKPECIQHIIGMDNFVCHDDFAKMIEDVMVKASVYRSFRAVWKIINTYTAILNAIDNKKEVFQANLPNILTTIVYLKKIIGIKRACKVFGISINQFNYWKKSFCSCSSSPLKLCRKTYNHQLACYKQLIVLSSNIRIKKL